MSIFAYISQFEKPLNFVRFPVAPVRISAFEI